MSNVTASAADSEWKCGKCKSSYGPSEPTFCGKCMEPHDEPDGDEEEAKAFGAFACEALKVTSLGAARGALAKTVEDRAALEAARAELASLKADATRRELRAVLKAGVDGKTLSLGAIQKSLPVVLRGDAKAQWVAAMSKVETVTADAVIDAAASVALAADDLEAVREYVAASGPIAAPAAVEPPRDPAAESADMDPKVAEIDRIAAAIRKQYQANTAAAPASAK